MKQSEVSLRGNVAIVTGGGRGVGRTMALGFARHGADVVVVARKNRDQIEGVAAEARAAGVRALAVTCDVTNEEQIDHMVGEVDREFGRADILFNNVGGGLFLLAEYDPAIRALAGDSTGPAFWDMKPDLWESVVKIDLTSVFMVSRAVTRHFFLKQKSGTIINNSARHAVEPLPVIGFSAYSACKAAVNHLTRVMAVELKTAGVTSNALSYPLLKTAETEGTIFEKLKDKRGGWFRPEIGLPAALYLAGPEGAKHSGEILACLEWNEQNGFGSPQEWLAT
ncbi:MAG: SDR family NAD(P)-dependent oxidoreductase [Burkholderiales bacterium]